jgi:hypothetical protein
LAASPPPHLQTNNSIFPTPQVILVNMNNIGYSEWLITRYNYKNIESRAVNLSAFCLIMGMGYYSGG